MVMINQVSEPLEGAVMEEVTKGVMLGMLAAGKESNSYRHDHEARGPTKEPTTQSSSWLFGGRTTEKQSAPTKKNQTFPWDAEAVKLITGSRQDQANKPLGDILKEDLKLTLLTEFESSSPPAVDEKEWNTRSWKTNKDNRIHGYIAQNDDMVVLAFSSRQSAFDWMADVDTSTAFWKKDLSSKKSKEEEMPTFSPDMFCNIFGSGGASAMCQSSSMITVNRYFYQLFLEVWPKIEPYIKVFLRSSARPRTLHIVGHSLGGAIATLVGCHLILEYDWNQLPHDLVVVTSGSPRSVSPQLKSMIEARRRLFALNTRVYRVVKGSDAIITLPPPRSSGGLEHLVDPILITDSGEIGWHLMGEAFDTNVRVLRKAIQNAQLSKFVQHHRQDAGEGRDDDYGLGARSDSFEYSKLVTRLPKALRDHLPTSYLQPLLNAQGWRYGSVRECFSEESYTQTPEQRQAKARENRSKPANYVPKRFLREQHPEEIHW
mmetsp:Transcript_11130/g.26832  ORF Transcript_11130/g.26832 Transcript_11130/m.26832 type:complete len:488 (+) Transcript_11130:193-1656(+)